MTIPFSFILKDYNQECRGGLLGGINYHVLLYRVFAYPRSWHVSNLCWFTLFLLLKEAWGEGPFSHQMLR